MENSRFRGRKRYCCYYCNTYFYQVDSWQRHNRKHTGVEIECDDCGDMCSDHFELKAHQQLCEAYRVYAEENYTLDPSSEHQTSNRRNSVSDRTAQNSNIHETPDSTSKQESIPENDEDNENSINDILLAQPTSTDQTTPLADNDNVKMETTKTKESDSDLNKDLAKSQALDHLIGEDNTESENISQEEDDPDTEALIGIDQSEVSHIQNTQIESQQLENSDSIGVDTQIVIKVESALNERKHLDHKMDGKDGQNVEITTFINRPSPVGAAMDTVHTISLDNSDMNKKYQPYFCKNCGARFTRKDSVTRHLKKGTCSGKSAIVCNICGKVFSEMFELQDHFKMEHKNVVFTPSIVHRSILPRAPEAHEQSHYAHYPTHYVVHDQHVGPVSRQYMTPEQTFRPMPPGLQTMFYGNQSSYAPRPRYPPPAGHFHEQIFPARPVELKYSPNNHVGKDITFVNNPGKVMMNRSDERHRKRDYHEFRGEEQSYHEENELSRKGRKFDTDYNTKQHHHSPVYRVEKTHGHKNINLSEYTSNAMSSKQYYDHRFVNKAPSAGKDEPPRVHQCKVCGLEFPRFEYLLTHLRKHKEKADLERGGTRDDRNQNNIATDQNETQTREVPDSSYPAIVPETYVSTSMNDSNSSSSDDNNDQLRQNIVMAQSSEKLAAVYSAHDPVPIVVPQPHSHYGAHHPVDERYMHHHKHHEQVPLFPSPHMQQSHAKPPHMAESGPVEAITPGVDGKFRPFICENCGQRFTRKDSLVRHAKKQTCFEEAADLKCIHCDKTFRYHKCLVQHQELVHGILPSDEKNVALHSEDEESESDQSETNEMDEEARKFKISENKYRDEKFSLQPEHESARTRMTSSYQVNQHSQYHNYHPPKDHYQSPLSKDHPPSQAHVGQQQHLSGPKFIPPKLEEKATLEANQGVNNQDSQYIGYCMLPRPFQCEYCGDRFAHRHSLKRHVRRHLGIGIPCHDCGKLYRDQSEWRRHQRSIHNRHYEKYEVPSRMSFRDGIEQGLIGVIPNSELDNEDGTDSDKSDEELSMLKTPCRSDLSPIQQDADATPTSTSQTTFANRMNRFNQSNPPEPNESTKKDELQATYEKEEKLKSLNFKSLITGDKDSRKSVLDLYLCSPHSDENEFEKNNNQAETHI